MFILFCCLLFFVSGVQVFFAGPYTLAVLRGHVVEPLAVQVNSTNYTAIQPLQNIIQVISMRPLFPANDVFLYHSGGRIQVSQ